MKRYELFEELLGILGLYYTIIRTSPAQVTVKPPESENYITIEWNDGLITVTAPEDRIWVFHMEDRISVGVRALDVENILIQVAKLNHQPIALSLYLYYTLLGLLWGARTDQTIRDKDPMPVHQTYLLLYGNTKDGRQMTYVYGVDRTGRIFVDQYDDAKTKLGSFQFYPVEYIDDPEKTVEKFFEFFKDIEAITKAGRG